MKNNKGLEEFVTIAIFVIALLVAGMVVLSFTATAEGTLRGSVEAKVCRWTLTTDAAWNRRVESMAQAAHDKIVEKGDSPWYKHIYTFGFSYAAEVATDDLADDTQEAFRALKHDMAKCTENTSVECAGGAAYVSQCVYKKAVQTFYVLGGGLPGGDDSPQRTGFNLFKIYVNITNSKEITLNGTELCNDLEASAGGAYDNYKSIGENCNVTINKLSEDTMTLAMVDICQEVGPDNPTRCKCFVSREDGHSDANGLPNNISLVRKATYGSEYEYIEYTGCGNIDKIEYRGKIELGQATIEGRDLITWTANQPIIEGTLYTRITDDGKKVVIENK